MSASELIYGSDDDVERALRGLPVKLHRSREAFSGQFRSTLQSHDLTDPQWRVLRILSVADEVDVAELARRSMLLAPSLSRIVRDLLARRLITRRVDDQDARRALVAISADGRDIVARVSPLFSPVFDRLAGRMRMSRVRQLNALLDELIEALC